MMSDIGALAGKQRSMVRRPKPPMHMNQEGRVGITNVEDAKFETRNELSSSCVADSHAFVSIRSRASVSEYIVLSGWTETAPREKRHVGAETVHFSHCEFQSAATDQNYSRLSRILAWSGARCEGADTHHYLCLRRWYNNAFRLRVLTANLEMCTFPRNR
jgi:hypothetical protein